MKACKQKFRTVRMSIYRHPRYTAASCGTRTVALHRGSSVTTDFSTNGLQKKATNTTQGK